MDARDENVPAIDLAPLVARTTYMTPAAVAAPVPPTLLIHNVLEPLALPPLSPTMAVDRALRRRSRYCPYIRQRIISTTNICLLFPNGRDAQAFGLTVRDGTVIHKRIAVAVGGLAVVIFAGSGDFTYRLTVRMNRTRRSPFLELLPKNNDAANADIDGFSLFRALKTLDDR